MKKVLSLILAVILAISCLSFNILLPMILQQMTRLFPLKMVITQ